MSKDKKKSGKKAKSQAEAAVEAMANVTGNAKAAQKALKAGKKLAAEVQPPKPSEHAVEGEQPEWGAALDGMRVADAAQGTNEKVMRILRKQRVKDAQKGNMDLDWNEPNLTLETKDKPRPVEVVEPLAGQVSAEMMLSPKEREQFEKAMKKAGKLAQSAIDKTLNDMQGEPGVGEPFQTAYGEITPEAYAEAVKMAEPTPEAPADPAPEAQGSVPTPTETRKYTDNLLVLLKQAQESADLDNREQTVVCPRKYVTKNYGVQLIKKYAPEGLNLAATEDTFVPPDRDHPKGMWEVTLKVRPNKEAPAEDTPELPSPEESERLLKKELKKLKKHKK